MSTSAIQSPPFTVPESGHTGEFRHLSDELLLLVLTYLEKHDLQNTSSVNSRMRAWSVQTAREKEIQSFKPAIDAICKFFGKDDEISKATPLLSEALSTVTSLKKIQEKVSDFKRSMANKLANPTNAYSDLLALESVFNMNQGLHLHRPWIMAALMIHYFYGKTDYLGGYDLATNIQLIEGLLTNDDKTVNKTIEAYEKTLFKVYSRVYAADLTLLFRALKSIGKQDRAESIAQKALSATDYLIAQAHFIDEKSLQTNFPILNMRIADELGLKGSLAAAEKIVKETFLELKQAQITHHNAAGTFMLYRLSETIGLLIKIFRKNDLEEKAQELFQLLPSETQEIFLKDFA